MKLFIAQVADSFSLVPYLKERLSDWEITKTSYVYTNNAWQQVVDLAPDVIFIDFCDDNARVITARLGELQKRPKVVIRLHGYEAQTEYLRRITWGNVSDLVVVSPRFREIVRGKLFKHPTLRIHLIPNGVDLDKYQLQDEASLDSNLIAYVGYLNKKKGPTLLRTVWASMPERQFHVGGTIQDEQVGWYLKDLELPNVTYHGWVQTQEFLKGKRFLLSTSVTESFGMGIAEAMAMGLTPLIHAWPGADQIWPKECLWNTFQELRVIEPKDPAWCREWVESRYSMEQCIDKFVALLGG